MTYIFGDLTITNCMLIFILEFIHIWSDCISGFEYKMYLLAENQKIDFTWSSDLEIIKAYLFLLTKQSI